MLTSRLFTIHSYSALCFFTTRTLLISPRTSGEIVKNLAFIVYLTPSFCLSFSNNSMLFSSCNTLFTEHLFLLWFNSYKMF